MGIPYMYGRPQKCQPNQMRLACNQKHNGTLHIVWMAISHIYKIGTAIDTSAMLKTADV